MNIQLDSLTIRAFRGIRHEERLQFDGDNSIIVGPNGSGKSTVLQALEFLLTGEISALSGSGTGGIRATEHVPNRYADASETAVQARFRTDSGEEVSVVREFSDRSRMQASARPEAFRELVSAADQGLLHLSRDELLELVVSTPGSRKDQIYRLMNTGSLDERRKQLKRLKRDAASEADHRERLYEDELDSLRDTAGPEVVTENRGSARPNPEVLREAVNNLRSRLGGDPLGALHEVDSFQRGLTSPLDQASNPLQRDDVQNRLETFVSWVDTGAEETASTLASLREELRSLQADEDALAMLAEQSLVEQGRQMVDEGTTSCPLCQEPWESGALESHLEARAERLAQIDERVDRVRALATTAQNEVDRLRQNEDRLVDSVRDETVSVDLEPLVQHRDALAELVERLSADVTADPQAVALDRLELPAAERTAAADVVTELQRTADSLPSQSMIERSWSRLQTLDDAYETLQRAREEQEQYRKLSAEFESAHETFLQSRDDVLGEVFDTISDRFAAFYGAINPDESAFDPRISQTNTGVDFSVGFYDSGEHPPHALHSEGHQDLMGVCLFLALASELSPLDRHPILLDDIVMSVDSDHRVQFARVLRDELSDHFQLLLTTHDTAWARQLVDAGVASQGQVVRFDSWEPTEGPTLTTGL